MVHLWVGGEVGMGVRPPDNRKSLQYIWCHCHNLGHWVTWSLSPCQKSTVQQPHRNLLC